LYLFWFCHNIALFEITVELLLCLLETYEYCVSRRIKPKATCGTHMILHRHPIMALLLLSSSSSIRYRINSYVSRRGCGGLQLKHQIIYYNYYVRYTRHDVAPHNRQRLWSTRQLFAETKNVLIINSIDRCTTDVVSGVQCPAGPFAHFRAMEADTENVVEKSSRKNVRPEVTTLWQRLVSYMFEPEDGECLAALRIAFGEFNATIIITIFIQQ